MSRIFVNFFCLLVVLCFSVGVVRAQVPTPMPVPVPDKKLPKDPKIKDPKIKTYPPPPGHDVPGVFEGDDDVTSEKSMVVDGNVAIKLCVAHGDLKINGWRRNEVRVFVQDGRQFKLKPLEKSAEGKVNWLSIGNFVEGRPGPGSECLAGSNIEIDAPVGANFDLSAEAAQTSVDSVKKIKVQTRRGMISLRNITGGIDAYTAQGDIIVENSSGAIEIVSTTGNIVAVEVSPGQVGDLFKARTNSGTVSLQRVDHRQIEANSISGSLLFEGKILTGGIYTFRSTAGSINLSIPEMSSCMIKATYGVGSFKYDIALKILTENITPSAKIVVGKIGAGDAKVSVSTDTGKIEIKKTVSKL